MLPELQELQELLMRRSIRKGDFVLSSGQRSNYYCDTKATVLSPRGARLIGEILFQALCDAEVEAVGGLAMGATYLAAAAALTSDLHGSPIYGFTVREKQKAHGMMKSVEQSFHPDGRQLLSPGRRVALVEDVVTSGSSVLKAVGPVRDQGCKIVGVLAIVDRASGGEERIIEEGLPYSYFFRADQNGDLEINDCWRARSRSCASAAGPAESS